LTTSELTVLRNEFICKKEIKDINQIPAVFHSVIAREKVVEVAMI
jgi:hypothetical protein